MIMLFGALVGCFVGWIGGRWLHMDQIETITDISFATLGAWIAGGVALRALHITFGTAFDPMTSLASVIGAVIGVAFYQLVFHPHHTGGRRQPPIGR